MTLAFCNIVAIAVSALEQAGGEAVLSEPVQQATFSPMVGVAVSRLDSAGVAPVGIGLLLFLAAQGAGRAWAAERHNAKIRSGFFLPSPNLGTVGRTWGFEDLAPSRQAELEVTLGGCLMGLAAASALCAVGILRGDVSGELLFAEVTRLPLLLAKLIGDTFPPDISFSYVGLKSGTQDAATSVASMVPVDPFIFSGGLADSPGHPAIALTGIGWICTFSFSVRTTSCTGA